MLFEVEPTKESVDVCDCCGYQTRTLWGYVHEKGGNTLASYIFQWTVGKSIAEHPANFDLIFGAWGEGTSKNDRCAISLIYFASGGVPGVQVIDANDRPIGSSELVASAKSREELIGTPLAQQAFAIFDAVALQDKRLR